MLMLHLATRTLAGWRCHFYGLHIGSSNHVCRLRADICGPHQNQCQADRENSHQVEHTHISPLKKPSLCAMISARRNKIDRMITMINSHSP